MTFDITMETTNHFKEVKFEWKIKNFSKLTDEIEGPAFFPMSQHPFRWKVVLQFGAYYIYAYLNSLDEVGAAPPLKVKGNIYFKNSEGLLWKQNPFDVIIKAGENIQCWNLSLSSLGYRPPGAIQSMFALIDDVFVVECSMTVSGVITSMVTPVSVVPVVEKEDEDICNALKWMYKKNAFTDVTFNIGKQTITSHKAVLSARSSVFEKMFEHDTLEKQNSSIDIKDFDFRIFDCFIGFLYTKEIRSEVKNDVTSLLALYEVADKYNVLDLQKYCADILLSRYLNVTNICSIVETADMHNDKYLKEPAMEFIRHRFSEVAETSEWSILMKSNIVLASNIVSYVTTFVDGKKPKEN